MKGRLPMKELRAAMRAGVVDLLDEVCREDGLAGEPAAAAGRRALERALTEMFEKAPEHAIRWEVFDGMTFEQVRVRTRDGLRDEVRRALAPARPS